MCRGILGNRKPFEVTAVLRKGIQRLLRDSECYAQFIAVVACCMILCFSVYLILLRVRHDSRSDLQNENHQHQEGILNFQENRRILSRHLSDL